LTINRAWFFADAQRAIQLNGCTPGQCLSGLLNLISEKGEGYVCQHFLDALQLGCANIKSTNQQSKQLNMHAHSVFISIIINSPVMSN
jgi:hypothetical protein